MLHEIAVKILLTLSTFLGVTPHPPAPAGWEIISDWKTTEEGYLIFLAKSDELTCKCKENPTYYIEFPTTIHASSQVRIGKQIIATTSSPDFKYTHGFYGSLVIPCYQIANSKKPLTWQVISYTQYFAWFHYFPKLVSYYPTGNIFKETLHIGAAGILLILSALYLIIFMGKVSIQELMVLVLNNLFTAIYFMGTVMGFIGMNISMLITHKIADTGLLIGFLFFIHFLYLEQLVLKWMNITYKIAVFIALIIIFSGTTGDTIQLGTTIPFLFTLLFPIYSIILLIKKGILDSKKNLFQFIGLFFTCFAVFNDLLIVTGIYDNVPIAPIGITGSYVFILFSVNQRINRTYTERDQLKVLTEDLRQANIDLEKTQGELIKSEKMAVMGRAVARIAHELNTPIYLARSSTQNIVSQTKKFLATLHQKSQKELHQLTAQYDSDIKIMTKGLMHSVSRAAELIRNFKEISTDQIQVKPKEFELLDYIKTSLATMKDLLKRKNITVHLRGDTIHLYHESGLFYQIIQNLLSNSEKYAYDNGGTIDIHLQEVRDKIIIVFSDYGKGIPPEHVSKIFDAFYTTGGGSGGIGLGLNIVYRVVTNQLKGEITCKSTLKEGTTFTITIPKSFKEE